MPHWIGLQTKKNNAGEMTSDSRATFMAAACLCLTKFYSQVIQAKKVELPLGLSRRVCCAERSFA